MLLPTSGAIYVLFSVMAVAFVVTAGLVIIGRAWYDRRNRLLRRIEGASRQRALELVAGTRTSSLMRLASEGTPPRDMSRLIAALLLDRIGLEKVRRIALTPGSDGSQWRRIGALRILALGRPEAAWDCFERAFASGGPEVGTAAVTLLSKIADRRAAKLLIRVLHAGHVPRSRVAAALEALPLPVGDLVFPLLESGEPALQYWGALLMRHHPATPGLEERLIALTDSHDAPVRKAALQTLAAIGATHAENPIRRRLQDPVPFVRAHAARALGALQVTAAAEDIARLLADKEWTVRFAARQSLQKIGPGGVKVALTYLSHPDAFARNGAAEVLQDLRVFEQMLTAAATEPATAERLTTLHVLARAGGVRMWDAVLSGLNAPARERARVLLGTMGLAGGVPQEVIQ